MERRLRTALRRWLAAERRGADALAEDALAEVFAELALLSPSPGFADRVLLAAGLAAPVTAFSRTARLAIAAALLAAGLTLAFALPVIFGLSQLVAPSEVVAGLVQGFAGLVGRFDEALSLWRVVTWVVDTLTLVATAPPFALTVATLLALSALACRGLAGLLTPQRSPRYALPT